MGNKFSDSRQICRLTTNLQTRKGHKYTYLRERSLVTGRGGLFLIFGDQKIVPPPKTFAERVIRLKKKKSSVCVTNSEIPAGGRRNSFFFENFFYIEFRGGHRNFASTLPAT